MTVGVQDSLDAYLAWAIEQRSIAQALRLALPLPGYGAVLDRLALQGSAAARAMGPVQQRWGLALQRSELNPASFECPCRQTVRSGEPHRR